MKIKHKVFGLIFFIASEFVNAQSVSKLMQSIQNYDYYHTKVYAHKMLKNRKKISAGAYALAYVYYQKYQPFHNIDSADKFIHLAILNYPHKPYISRYGKIDSITLYALYDSIVNEQFNKIKQNIFPKLYDAFISRHPFMSKSIKENIKKYQYQKITEYIEKINKSDTTLHYITTYTSHPQMALLYQILDNQLFNEYTKHQTAAEYLLFLRNFPNNKNREKALQALLNIYINEKNTTGLRNFAKEFHQDKYYVEQAWKWLFTYSVKKFNNDELEKFMQEYPDFPYKQEILSEMEMNSKILIPFTDSLDNVGFIDTSGTFVIPPVYDAASDFIENISVVYKNDSAYFINKNHQKIIQHAFKEAYPFYNGYAPVFDGQEWFFINRLGAKQSESFEWISEKSADNNYIFKKNNLYGLCDYKGQILLDAQFEKLGDFENHKTYYSENNLYGIIYDDGKKYPAQYQWISVFYKHYAIIKKNNLYGIINEQNEDILSPEYDLIFHCYDNIFIVIKNKKYGFYDAKSKCFVYDIKFDYNKNSDVKNFTNENYFKLISQNKTHIGNNNGIYIHKKNYQDAMIDEHFILVKNKNTWEILIPSTNAIKNLKSDEFKLCDNHTLIAQTHHNFFIIDKHGNIKYSTKNNINHIFKNYYYEQTDDEKGNIIDITGNIILQDVSNYKVVTNYIVATKQDKTTKVIR